MKTKTYKLKPVIAIFLALVLVLGFYADTFAQSLGDIQREIERLNEDISDSEKQIQELRDKEDTLQNRLAILNAEANQLQSEINRTERQIKDVQDEIKQKEAELERTKELIQENAKILYKQGNPSTIEVLFSSENFTDFINRREYLDRVKTSLNDAAKEAVAIREDLEEKESDLEVKSSELNIQKRQLSSRQDEQRRLIAETRGQEARYQELVAQQKQDLKEAERRQAAIIAAARANSGNNIPPGSVGNGGYPDIWAPPVPMNSQVDSWGYYSRQCTSYVAWRRAADGNPLPVDPVYGQHWGFLPYIRTANANDWPWWASRAGMEMGSQPQVGAIAVLTSGQFGHVAVVEEVFGGGSSFRVSEYNADWTGHFANYNTYLNSSSWVFIY